MRLLSAMRALLALIVLSPSAIFAQSSQSVSSASVPRLINITGVFRPADGQPAGRASKPSPSRSTPTRRAARRSGRKPRPSRSTARAATRCCSAPRHADGIPPAVFASGDAQWLGTVFERAGEVEGPRVRIDQRALCAARRRCRHARRASGVGLSAAPPPPTASRQPRRTSASDALGDDRRAGVQPGTANFLAKYVNAADVGNSAIYESRRSGRHRHHHAARLPARARSTTPAAPSPASPSRTWATPPTSYSGMLFYDQNGALGQFQGFNNVTHEYRINNVARTGRRHVQRLDQLHARQRLALLRRPATATSASAPPRRRRSSKSAMPCPAGPRTCG